VDGQFQLSRLGRIAASELQSVPRHYTNVQVDLFIVMPNHVHAIVMIGGTHSFSPNSPKLVPALDRKAGISPPPPGSLSAIIRSYKAGVTRRCHELGLMQVVWQARFHDHLLRGDVMIDAVRDYIRNNPANWPQDENYR
jgi:REP element-mobilizing transposase RayT